jgi:hypothetical protein
MCGTAPITSSCITTVQSSTSSLVVLRATSNPYLTFWLHPSSPPNTGQTRGARVTGTLNYEVNLCSARWTEIRSIGVGAGVTVSWDSNVSLTHMEFDA